MSNTDSKKNKFELQFTQESINLDDNSVKEVSSILQQYHSQFGNQELQGLVSKSPISPMQNILVGDIGTEIAGMSVSSLSSNSAMNQSMQSIAQKPQDQTLPKEAVDRIQSVLLQSGRTLPPELQAALQGRMGNDGLQQAITFLQKNIYEQSSPATTPNVSEEEPVLEDESLKQTVPTKEKKGSETNPPKEELDSTPEESPHEETNAAASEDASNAAPEEPNQEDPSGPPQNSSAPPDEQATATKNSDEIQQLPAMEVPTLSEEVYFQPQPILRTTAPKMDKKSSEKFTEQKKVGPKEAYAKIESEVDRVAAESQRYKDQIQSEISSIESSISSLVSNKKSSLISASSSARSIVNIAFGSAKELIASSCKISKESIGATIDANLAEISTLSQTKRSELTAVFTQIQEKVSTLRVTAPEELKIKIAAMGELFDTAYQTSLPEMEQLMSEALQNLPSGSVEDTFKGQYIKEILSEQQASLKNNVELQKNQYRDVTLETYQSQAQAIVDSVLVPLQQELYVQYASLSVGIEQSIIITNASLLSEKENLDSNFDQLQTQSETSIDSNRDSALSSINTSEERGQIQLENTGTQLTSTLRDSSRDFGAVYDSQILQLQVILDQASVFPDYSEAEPRISAIRKSLEGAASQHQNALARLQQSISEQLQVLTGGLSGNVEKMGSQASQQINGLANQGKLGIEQRAAMITQNAMSLSQSISAQINNFSVAMIEKANQAESKSVELLQQEESQIYTQLEVAAGKQHQLLQAQTIRSIEASKNAGIKMAKEKRSSLSKKAASLFDAMDGWGTDEAAIFSTLRGLSSVEGRMLKHIYSDHYKGQNLRSKLRDELNDTDYARANAALSGNKVQATLISLEESIGFWNDDEATIKAELRSLSSEELMQLHKLMNNNPEAQQIIEKVRDNLGGEDLDIFNTFVEADTDGSGNIILPNAEARNLKADAIEVYHAMDGWGTNEEKVYSGLEGKSQAELKQMEAAYLAYATEKQVHKNQNSRRKRNINVLSLEEQIKADFQYTGDGGGGDNYEGDIALGLLDGDDVAVRAARLEKASDGGLFGWGTDEKAILTNLKADIPSRPEATDPLFVQKMERYNQAQQERSELNQLYEEKYGRTIESMLNSELGKNQEKDPMRRLAQQTLDTGDGDRATKIEAAMDGWGTNEALLKEAFTDSSGNALPKDEVQKLLKDIGQDGVNDILWEVGGKDQLDMEVLMLGKPENPADFQKISDMKHDFQRSGFSGLYMDAMGAIGVTESGEMLDYQKERLDGQLEQWESSGTQNVPEQVEHVFEYFNQDFESYEAAKNEVANTTGTALAVVASIAVVVATGGGAAPVLVALLTNAGMGASAATATATAIGAFGTSMAGSLAKGAIKGNSYSGEEFATDVSSAIMSSALSGGGEYIKHLAAAGKTNHLLDPLIKLQTTAGNLKDSDKLLTKIGGVLLEDLPKNVISNAFYTSTNQDNWDNDTLLQSFLTGMITRTGGIALSTTAGHYGSQLMGSFTKGVPQGADDPAQGYFNKLLTANNNDSKLVSFLSNSHVQAQYNTAISSMAFSLGSKTTAEVLTYLSDPIAYDKDLAPLIGNIFKASSIGTMQAMIKKIPAAVAANGQQVYGDLKNALADGKQREISTALNALNREQQARLFSVALNVSILTKDLSTLDQTSPLPIVRSHDE
jgi:hypothetical protein